MDAATTATAHRPRLMLVSTVANLFDTVLAGQPRALADRFEVHLAASPGPRADQVAAREGLPVHGVPMRRGIAPFADVASIWRLWRLMRTLRPRIVHSYTPKAGMVAMIAARLAGVPVRIHTFTGLIWPTATGLRRRLLMATDALTCRMASRVIAESRGVRRDLVAGGISPRPVEMVGTGNIAGVDVDRFDPDRPGLAEQAAAFRATCGIAPERPLFLFIGRFNRDKGLDELAAAFAPIAGQASLVLVGRHDDEAPAAPATLARLAADGSLEAGFLADVVPALAAADALVLPSYREGFPNVLLEAGAMRLPVIATDINGSNELVEPGVTGWIVPPRDADALADAMRALVAMPPARRRAMGDAARAIVVERFERRAHVARMVALYADAVAACPGVAAPR